MLAGFIMMVIFAAFFPIGFLMVYGLHRWAGGTKTLWQFLKEF